MKSGKSSSADAFVLRCLDLRRKFTFFEQQQRQHPLANATDRPIARTTFRVLAIRSTLVARFPRDPRRFSRRESRWEARAGVRLIVDRRCRVIRW